MSETQQEVSVEAREEAPILAHYGNRLQTPCVALCGKRLIGVPAPHTAPLCVVCQEMWVASLSEPSP